MRTKLILTIAGLCAACAITFSCASPGESGGTEKTDVVLMDYGAQPAVLNIDDYTLANESFRTVLWTGGQMQVTVMSIPGGGQVGLELHPETDQFIRVEQGKAEVLMGNSPDTLDFQQEAGADFAIFIPAGKWHNIINRSNAPLKLYSIHTPVEHPFGTVHETYEEALVAEQHHVEAAYDPWK
jgi:mannose-6-phosphate isomerase-like protein (cupin superfamily)